MQHYYNHPLSGITTFHTAGTAMEVMLVETLHEIHDLRYNALFRDGRFMVIGSGSNILFAGNYNGLLVQPAMKGIEVINESSDHIYLKVAAGELWDDVVGFACENNYGGLENLSMIPGSTGAAPIQNIGAYGLELSYSFHSLEAITLKSMELVNYDKEACRFSYRNSIFKEKYRGQCIILSVTFRLDKNPRPKLAYKDLQDECERRGIADPDVKQVREMICDIRGRKLPDPAIIGNAGSFFKNPEVDGDIYRNLIKNFPDLVAYPLPEDRYKLAAGWMIDQCGWKGRRFGDAGVHDKQALVLVNHGNASGSQILELAQKIRESVFQKYDVTLETEVNIIE